MFKHNHFNQNKQSRTSYRIVICFRNVRSLCVYVCELLSITRINKDVLFAI